MFNISLEMMKSCYLQYRRILTFDKNGLNLMIVWSPSTVNPGCAILTYIYIYIYIYISLVSWLTIVNGDPTTLFSIITTPMCWEAHYSFPWIALLTLDPYLMMLSVKQVGIKYHFLCLWYGSTWDWTSVSSDHWWTC